MYRVVSSRHGNALNEINPFTSYCNLPLYRDSERVPYTTAVYRYIYIHLTYVITLLSHVVTCGMCRYNIITSSAVRRITSIYTRILYYHRAKCYNNNNYYVLYNTTSSYPSRIRVTAIKILFFMIISKK